MNQPEDARTDIERCQGDDGANLVEYAMLMALIVVVCLAAVTFFAAVVFLAAVVVVFLAATFVAVFLAGALVAALRAVVPVKSSRFRPPLSRRGGENPHALPPAAADRRVSCWHRPRGPAS